MESIGFFWCVNFAYAKGRLCRFGSAREWRKIRMVENIVVVILCIIAVAAGIWCWWYENHAEVIIRDENGNIITEEEK